MADEDPPEPQERPESEPFPEERRYTELFGLPMMILIFALIAVVKGIIDDEVGFTIVGAVVAGGVFVAFGFSMSIAKKE
jgi:hypothetical protein